MAKKSLPRKSPGKGAETAKSAPETYNGPTFSDLQDELLDRINIKASTLFSAEQVERIDQRLSELISTVYLASNMAAIARSSLSGEECPTDIELATVLDHLSDLLKKTAEALSVDEIVPFAERAKVAP